MTQWITLLTFISVATLVQILAMMAYDSVLRYRFTVNARLKELSKDDGPQDLSLFRNSNQLSTQEASTASTWSERLGLAFCTERAGMNCSLHTFLKWSLSLAFVGLLLGLCFTWWFSMIAGALGATLPYAFLRARRHSRNRQLARQLPDVFRMISRSVRAGQTIPSALKIVAEDFQSPVSDEFALCYEQQNLGMSYQSAMRKLAERTGLMEMQIFVVALLVQMKYGGDLVELLDNLAATNQKRFALRDRVRALTGEGRMQALILFVLPILAFAGIVIFAPDYAASLLERPWLLVGTASAQALAVFWIHRIVNFEY